MYCGHESTSGNHLTRRVGSACGKPRDRNRWNVYCWVPLQPFLLRRAILLLHTFVRQNVHPLTVATFGDWLLPRARAHYYKSQINTVRSNDNNFLIRLWWNSDYSIKGSSQSSNGKIPVFFHLRHIYRYVKYQRYTLPKTMQVSHGSFNNFDSSFMPTTPHAMTASSGATHGFFAIPLFLALKYYMQWIKHEWNRIN